MIHIIVNPTAGKKKLSVKNLAAVKQTFTDNNLPFTVYETQKKGDGKEICRRLTEAGERDIVVVGGDGTLHEVLNGMANPAECRLGLIPSGTGNDFALSANIPMNAVEAAKLIVRGETKETDYIYLDGQRCMNVCGLGMDVDVLERCNRGKMRGKLKYLKSLLSSLFSFKGYGVEVVADGYQKQHSALIAAACNGQAFGGGIRICPTAEIGDKKLNVVLVECIGGKIKIIKAFLELMKGNILSYPATTHFLADKVAFIPEKPVTVQLDGELYTNVKFEAEIRDGLQMFR